jgi:hypothetical protein
MRWAAIARWCAASHAAFADAMGSDRTLVRRIARGVRVVVDAMAVIARRIG